MESVWRLLRAFPATEKPVRVLTDDIYPLHMLDDTKSLQQIVVTWTLRFDDVLDAEKLQASLSKLLEIGDWRKIGGRLRLSDEGALELHVPQRFSAERPAISYSHQVIAVEIEQHSLAKTLPKTTKTPSIQLGPSTFQEFAVRHDAPATLDDFIYHDIPPLSLHITSFNDATLVGLSWPHVLMDVMGQQALLRGWSLVLADRESEVPALLGAREDAVCAAIDSAVTGDEEEFKIGQTQLKGWGMLSFGLRFAWDMFCNPVVETRTIFLPQQAMASLRRQAEIDLATPEGEEKPYLSDNDLLTAWVARAVAASQPRARPITVLHVVNLRFRLPSLIKAPGVFVQNMAVAAFSLFTADTAQGKIGHTALENRRHLMEQTTEGQVLAFLRELRADAAGGDPRIICGRPDALLLPFTNWERADIFNSANFGEAVIRAKGEQADHAAKMRNNPPGTIVYHHAHSMRPLSVARNVIVVLGKDHNSSYWLNGTLLPATWAKIEEEIAKI